MIIDKKEAKIICVEVGQGRRHDFHLYKNSKVHIKETVKLLTDSGYQGIKKFHQNTALPKKSHLQSKRKRRIMLSAVKGF